jgi:3D (Asp-Asp-Asp) domain-containing protein
MKRIISRSLWRKLLATVVAMVAFVLLYEVTTMDSRDAARAGAVDPTAPAAGSRLAFSATAYCKGTTTASGVGVRTGIAASDPTILPVGSVISITTDEAKYNGIYTIMDTGPKVQGRILDVYMWSCNEALAFGRKQVEITVLRLGWNPNNSSPSLIDRLFRRREAARNAAPPAPVQGTTLSDGEAPASDGATVVPSTDAPNSAPGTLEPSAVAPSHLAPSHPEPLPAVEPVSETR